MYRLLLLLLAGCTAGSTGTAPLRVATFNVEDLRTDDLLRADHPRLQQIVATLQEIRPDIVLINEIAYDQPGVPGFADGDTPGQNGARLAALLAGGTDPLDYRAFMAQTNTGIASGFDLDHDGQAVTTYPAPPSADDDGTPARQTAEGRAYGNDNWGFGTFPGQYGMALLVRSDLEILEDEARTFRFFPWSGLQNATRPVDADTGMPWYDDEIWARFPLSSKSHWDVPVRLSDGTVVHILASHPTPAAFDGPEQRNKLRNRDEIRFWEEYWADAAYLVDDDGNPGGLAPGELFVLLGDQNADPDEGNAVGDPIGSFILSDARVRGEFVPVASEIGQARYPRLDTDDTAEWGLRVDYVLPSVGLRVIDGAIRRPEHEDEPHMSDHFPVWLDLVVER